MLILFKIKYHIIYVSYYIEVLRSLTEIGMAYVSVHKKADVMKWVSCQHAAIKCLENIVGLVFLHIIDVIIDFSHHFDCCSIFQYLFRTIKCAFIEQTVSGDTFFVYFSSAFTYLCSSHSYKGTNPNFHDLNGSLNNKLK